MAGKGRATHADASMERLATPATIVTGIRTIASVSLAAARGPRHQPHPARRRAGLYWIGDSIDGIVARLMNQETRIGATLDIMCDRMSAAMFYVGFAWYEPTMIPPVGIYLAEFMVIDMFLSLAFLAWPISSPNYFYLIDRRLYMWNWSRIGKAANSGLFAIFMVVTGWMWVGLAIALGLLTLKAAPWCGWSAWACPCRPSTVQQETPVNG